jgi:hypothetical protein
VKNFYRKGEEGEEGKMKNFYHKGHEGTQREIGTYLNCTLFFQKVSVKKPFKLRIFTINSPAQAGS